MKTYRLTMARSAFGAMLLTTAGLASAQVGSMTQYTNDTLAGSWFFNGATGRALYCQPVQNWSGNPMGNAP